MIETRTHRLELGPEPQLTRMQRMFLAVAAEQGWAPLLLHTEIGVTAVALQVAPIRPVATYDTAARDA